MATATVSQICYRWAAGSRVKANAQAAGEAIESLREDNGGEVTPQSLVDAARARSHPLHNAFEWDNSKAAELYRLQQARGIIAKLTIVVRGEKNKAPVRAYVSVQPSEDAPERTYMSLDRVMGDDGLRAQVLERAKREARDWSVRYKRLDELSKLHKVIAEVVG